MNKIKSTYNIRAIKNVDTDTVLIYRALHCGNKSYEISIERYRGNTLIEASSAEACVNNTCTLDKLLLDMCIGTLEPCHLKNVIDDMEEI
ncbi:MAG: hypothetical protein IJ391_04390 [Clostridia bacterium]|nr:hypothetical protein [Clostridia bacterium]